MEVESKTVEESSSEKEKTEPNDDNGEKRPRLRKQKTENQEKRFDSDTLKYQNAHIL